jgi:hypothetical protein
MQKMSQTAEVHSEPASVGGQGTQSGHQSESLGERMKGAMGMDKDKPMTESIKVSRRTSRPAPPQLILLRPSKERMSMGSGKERHEGTSSSKEQQGMSRSSEVSSAASRSSRQRHSLPLPLLTTRAIRTSTGSQALQALSVSRV